MKKNEVTVDTTITLIVALEKGSHDASSDDISQVKLPDSIEVTDENGKPETTISAAELKRLMDSTTPTTKGTKKTYTVKNGDREYTIEVDEGAAKELTNAQIFEKLEKMDSGKYQYDKTTDTIYYIGNGDEHAELTKEQNDTLRKTLSYTVTVTETKKSEEEMVSGKNEAEITVKTDALNNAVIDALKELGLNDDQAGEALRNGKFNETDHTFTYTLDGKTYTLNYTDPTTSEDPSKVTDLPDTPDATDRKTHTVTGTAQITTGTVSWTDSGSGGDSYSVSSGDTWTEPEGATKVKTEQDGNKTITTYRVTSADGKTVTTYVVTEEDVPLSDAEKNELAERLAWEQLEQKTSKTRAELEADGYQISSPVFTGSTRKISWTATQKQTTTSKTEESVSDIIYVDGDKKWTIDETAGTITVDGTPYTISQKNADGSYTCDVIDADNKKTSYTFTEKDRDFSLPAPQVKALLVDQLKDDFPGITAEDIQLSADGKTASYTKGSKTVTIDYSKLSKELDVMTEEHHTSSTVATIKKDEHYEENFRKACEKLLEEIKATPLDEGQELWIGNTKITASTTLNEDLINYFKKAVSFKDMSKDELIKALQAQAAEAHKTDVKVNEGKTDKYGRSYEETLRNYYSGADKKGTYYVKPDGSVQKLKYDYWTEKYYYWDSSSGKYVYPDAKDIVTYNHPDYIKHLDLASDSQLELLPDEQNNVETTDCVLIGKGLKLEWNYKADDLVKDKNNTNTTVSLEDEITFDPEDGKKGSGHYEYNRGSNYKNTLPTKSAYYKLTGTVVYDAVKGSDGNVTKYWNREDAKLAYCAETGRAYNTVSEEDFAKYVVKVGDKFQVYTKSSQLEAYGYMTRDANTCVNQTYERQYDSFGYGGGYDLMISKLIQVRDGMVVGQTSSDIQTITAPWRILSRDQKADQWLQLLKKTTETTTTNENPNFDSGSSSTTNGDYSYTYTQDHTDTLGSPVTGTGEDTYYSYRDLLIRTFTGNGTGHKDSGSFRYTYRTEKDAKLSAYAKMTDVEKKAHITYDSTTVESRDVLIPGTEIVHIDPDGGGDDGDDEIIDEKDPDSPVLPGTPELPPVQDAKPDAPVLPADPVLPAVQDAHALPQTGVNWLAAIGLALSGMTLMITGAFASLTGKNAKH